MTVQEFIEKLQSAIENGVIEEDDDVAVCSSSNPLRDYYFLTEEDEIVRYEGIAVIRY